MPKKPKSTPAGPKPPPPPSSKSPNTDDPARSKPATLPSPKDSAEWRAKNARAKQIIMSTLVPGSEPWQIAEPLELASDIWKALEDRYAPKKSGNEADNKSGPADAANFIAQWVADGKVSRPPKTDDNKADEAEDTVAAAAVVDAKPPSPPAPSPPTLSPAELARRKEAQAAAAKILVEHMPNRDQRFLWALLHGGKEETMAWFNGTAAGMTAGTGVESRAVKGVETGI